MDTLTKELGLGEHWIGTYILDPDGTPVPEPDILKWGAWMELADRSVAQDELLGDVRVSTVFLGLDQAFHFHFMLGFPSLHRPQLWETMIFGGPHDRYQERYTSREQAIEGHAVALKLARDELV